MFNVKSFMFGVLLFVVIDAADLSALSPKREEFSIANYSSQILVVYKEFWNMPEGNWWKQSINGFDLIFIDSYFYRSDIILRPRFPDEIYRNSYTIIRCFPSEWNVYYPDRDPYMEMADIPVMDKLRSIYKTLTIGTVDNPNMFTLDNMEEKLMQRQTPEKSPVYRYILEIYDDDLIIADGLTTTQLAAELSNVTVAVGVDKASVMSAVSNYGVTLPSGTDAITVGNTIMVFDTMPTDINGRVTRQDDAALLGHESIHALQASARACAERAPNA